ncbi:MAG: hypothetical protein IT371_04660 [Deltaproteobacteria bacterium]|nr:hypothetical protein [Deltaproteobacteria bacterium]
MTTRQMVILLGVMTLPLGLFSCGTEPGEPGEPTEAEESSQERTAQAMPLKCYVKRGPTSYWFMSRDGLFSSTCSIDFSCNGTNCSKHAEGLSECNMVAVAGGTSEVPTGGGECAKFTRYTITNGVDCTYDDLACNPMGQYCPCSK